MNPNIIETYWEYGNRYYYSWKKLKRMSGMHYREQFFKKGKSLLKNSLTTLSDSYEYLILEGAGSPVEVNLRERELVNMRVADLADVPVILVANIEYGGVFASIVGTLALLPEAQRAELKG